MPQSDDECRAVLQGRFPPDGPRPARPRRRRRTGARWTLASGVTALVTGVALAEGLLIATGLVLAGIGVHLFDVSDAQAGRPDRPSG